MFFWDKFKKSVEFTNSTDFKLKFYKTLTVFLCKRVYFKTFATISPIFAGELTT